MATWIRQTLNIATVRNDRFDVDIGIKDSVGVDIPASVITSARCHVRSSRDSSIVFEFNSDGSTYGLIVITDGNIKLSLLSAHTDITAGTYKYDIEFTLYTNDVVTAIAGNWTVINDITHD